MYKYKLFFGERFTSNIERPRPQRVNDICTANKYRYTSGIHMVLVVVAFKKYCVDSRAPGTGQWESLDSISPYSTSNAHDAWPKLKQAWYTFSRNHVRNPLKCRYEHGIRFITRYECTLGHPGGDFDFGKPKWATSQSVPECNSSSPITFLAVAGSTFENTRTDWTLLYNRLALINKSTTHLLSQPPRFWISDFFRT